MNSLRARQLVTTLGIMIIGILVLGLTLHYYYRTDAVDNMKRKLTDYNNELLGFFIFERGKFTIDPDSRAALQEFMQANNFASQGSDAIFAYLQDVSTKEILWHSYDPNEPKEVLQRTQSYLLTFDVTVDPLQWVKDEFRPVIPKNPPDPMPSVFKQYHVVVAQGFGYPPYSDYQLVVAGSLEAIENANKQQMTLLVILFFISILLVIVAQMALSFWVVAPIQEFEAEIRDIEAGKQDFIADLYPEIGRAHV